MGWPLSLVPARRAVKKLLNDRVIVLETWEDAFCRAGNVSIAMPKTVMLRQYVPIEGTPKFCRRSIILRDKFTCQFCSERFPSHELTYDHLLPRSRGGKTCWENIVTACVACNAEKGDRPARETGPRGVKGSLRPLRQPRAPTNAQLLRAGLEFLPLDIREDWGSWLHWNVTLHA
jgi:5-methylcytosine-specific restriction endonuclease McrA